MKKIALVLAMLLCLVPVLSACGLGSSPKNAVKQALDVKYGDGGEDVEDFYEVTLDYNLDVLEFLDDDDEKSDYKDEIRAAQKEVKKSLNSLEDIEDEMEEEDITDFDFSYEILYCNTYDDKSDYFDTLLKSFKYADTSVEDEVTEVAVVGVLLTTEYSDDDGDYTSVETDTFTLYKIDGNWYIA